MAIKECGQDNIRTVPYCSKIRSLRKPHTMDKKNKPEKPKMKYMKLQSVNTISIK